MILPPSEQDLERVRARDAGGQLNPHRGGGRPLLGEVEPLRVDEVPPLLERRRHPDDQLDGLVDGTGSFEVEVLVKAHFSRHEDQAGGSHSDRRCGDRRDALLVAVGEDRTANVEGVDVKGINKEIDIIQEVSGVFIRHPGFEDVDHRLRVDVEDSLPHHLDLWHGPPTTWSRRTGG